jgi:hypothetical protein
MNPLELLKILPNEQNPDSTLAPSVDMKVCIEDGIRMVQEASSKINNIVHFYNILNAPDTNTTNLLRSVSMLINKAAEVFRGQTTDMQGTAFGREALFVSNSNRAYALHWINIMLNNILTEYAMGFMNEKIWAQDLTNIQKTIEIIFMTAGEQHA